MKFPLNYSDENELRAAFSWLTRTGAGVKFGSRPIGWYQMHQMNALGELERLCAGPEGSKVRFRNGIFQYQMNGSRRWNNGPTASMIYKLADSRRV